MKFYSKNQLASLRVANSLYIDCTGFRAVKYNFFSYIQILLKVHCSAFMAEDPLLFPPVLSNKRVAELVQTNYAISHVDVDSIKLLNGYEDRNYYLKACCRNGEDKEYVFKMVNKKDSQYPEYFDALSKLMFFIKAEGLTCSLPIQPIGVPGGTYIIHLKKSFMLQVDIEEDCLYVGILLTYLHGQIMSEIEQSSPKLLYKVGEFVGKLSTSLQVRI